MHQEVVKFTNYSKSNEILETPQPFGTYHYSPPALYLYHKLSIFFLLFSHYPFADPARFYFNSSYSMIFAIKQCYQQHLVFIAPLDTFTNSLRTNLQSIGSMECGRRPPGTVHHRPLWTLVVLGFAQMAKPPLQVLNIWLMRTLLKCVVIIKMFANVTDLYSTTLKNLPITSVYLILLVILSSVHEPMQRPFNSPPFVSDIQQNH